jgi:hypothetical protein
VGAGAGDSIIGVEVVQDASASTQKPATLAISLRSWRGAFMETLLDARRESEQIAASGSSLIRFYEGGSFDFVSNHPHGPV